MAIRRKKKKPSISIDKDHGVREPAKGLGKENGVSWLGQVIATQEEIINAFRAKYGCEPEEVLMLRDCDGNDNYYWYLKKRKGKPNGIGLQ